MAVSDQAVVTGAQLDTLCINTIRTLAIDAVQQANSGHPGAPMGLAPVAYKLWQEFLRYDPEDPLWPNRDRFVLVRRPRLDAALLDAPSRRRAQGQTATRLPKNFRSRWRRSSDSVNLTAARRDIPSRTSPRALKPRPAR